MRGGSATAVIATDFGKRVANWAGSPATENLSSLGLSRDSSHQVKLGIRLHVAKACHAV